MRNLFSGSASFSVVLLLLMSCASIDERQSTQDFAENIIGTSFSAPAPRLLQRLTQDRSQQICSKVGGAKLTQAEAAEVVELARGSIKYPASGKLSGDWKTGETLAHDGAGDRIQFGKLEQRKENGGLCQNCHALEPGEINVGNVGPPLTGFGAARGNAPEI